MNFMYISIGVFGVVLLGVIGYVLYYRAKWKIDIDLYITPTECVHDKASLYKHDDGTHRLKFRKYNMGDLPRFSDESWIKKSGKRVLEFGLIDGVPFPMKREFKTNPGVTAFTTHYDWIAWRDAIMKEKRAVYKEDQGFFQKYGTYLIIFFLILAVIIVTVVLLDFATKNIDKVVGTAGALLNAAQGAAP